ncbi:hypothetical protein V565_003630 [Rhizoctonia solani 123E]|uniref:Uncharacterized protein n=1 Tax=Rhizoctonia solani 123E TaxID=1423351 RepID=A0A074SFL4_9AGAM|nr:hypothetical protein V565_003630 [Rhizoctonia solani 123E]
MNYPRSGKSRDEYIHLSLQTPRPMSDDEYFGDDDLFTSEALDNIPALNQPPSPVLAASDLPNPPVQPPPQPVSTGAPGSNVNNPIVVESTNGATRAPGSQRASPEQPRRTSSRFSTIMNALRTGSTQQPGSGRVFGQQTGLLRPPNRKYRSVSSQLSPSQSSVAGPSRLPSQPSPIAGLKRRRSPSRDDSVEAEIRADTWSVVEEELTCAICCDVFVAPQITHCGHSACAYSVSLVWLASSMIDRMMAEATKHKLPDWCTGGKKEVEWKKRKRLWEGEVARETAAARNRVTTRSVAAPRHRVYMPQPLFLDDEDYDNYDYDDLGYEDEYDYNLY